MLKLYLFACAGAAPLPSHASSGQAAARQALPPADHVQEQLSGSAPGMPAGAPVPRPFIGAPDFSLRLADALLPVDGRSRCIGRSSRDVLPGLNADFPLRRVARLPQRTAPGYHALDARLAWEAADLDLALAGHDLPHAHHPGSGTAGLRQLAERSSFASASPRF